MTSTSDEEPICEKCHNSGWEMYTDENGCIWQRECSCGYRQKMIMRSRIKFATIPEMYKGIKLSDLKTDVYKTPEAKDIFIKAGKAVKYWLSNLDKMLENGKGLFFVSKAKGSGKTMTAVAIANELLLNRNIPVKFATFNQILEAIKGSWEEKGESESKLLADLQNIKVLVIDEFGISKATPWVNEKFYSIINGRYTNKLVTIFTSNMSLAESTEVGYDERITDRIREMCYLIAFPGESVRRNIMDENRRDLLC